MSDSCMEGPGVSTRMTCGPFFTSPSSTKRKSSSLSTTSALGGTSSGSFVARTVSARTEVREWCQQMST